MQVRLLSGAPTRLSRWDAGDSSKVAQPVSITGMASTSRSEKDITGLSESPDRGSNPRETTICGQLRKQEKRFRSKRNVSGFDSLAAYHRGVGVISGMTPF